jgi:hypothetical protein
MGSTRTKLDPDSGVMSYGFASTLPSYTAILR